MVSAILLHYVIDDPLPNRGTFGGPGAADNFFFFDDVMFFFFFPHAYFFCPHALAT